MRKYYIGFIVLGILVGGMFVFTVWLGISGRQDLVTERKAEEASEKIDNYIIKHNKLPDTLETAGLSDVPKTIVYTKKDETTYTFCMTYNRASDAGVVSGIEDVVGGTALGDTELSDDSLSDSSGHAGYLDTYGPHKKGQNCQTVEPYVLSGFGSRSNANSTGIFDSFGTGTAGSQSQGSDAERQTDINELHAHLEAYYAQYGRYPTRSDINSSTWRSANMKGISADILKDPSGTTSVLVATPAKNVYAYEPIASDGDECDNVEFDCLTYDLTATLTSGNTYVKQSLN